jgi:hypothetical protein
MEKNLQNKKNNRPIVTVENTEKQPAIVSQGNGRQPKFLTVRIDEGGASTANPIEKLVGIA